MNKFKEGQLVVSQKGTSLRLGVIKEVVNAGSHEEGKLAYNYFVWYHTGDTASLTSEEDLQEIENAYAFLVLRRKEDTDSINDTPARELAAEIIDGISQLTDLEGDPYYECEDELTELINKWKGGAQ
jgi:hypothetical protein